jgi:hypothetical protein
MKTPVILAALLLLATFSPTLPAQRGGMGGNSATPGMGNPTSTSSINNPLGVQQSGLDTSRTRANSTSQMATQLTPPPSSGGSMSPFRSIAIQPTPDAPFTATVVTEWERFLPDGSTDTTKSHQLIARDSTGRIFEEWRSLAPNGNKKETSLIAMEYIDPTQQTHYRCTSAQFKACQLLPYTASAAPGTLVKKSELGAKRIENLDATGTREIVTLDAARGGGKETFEAWFSPKLQINLAEKHASTDILAYTVKSISLAEPDPKLFEFPDGYRVVAARK